MKKLFTLLTLVLITISYSVVGQSARLVLAEEFTQASCPPCASQNPAFNTLLNNNPTKVVAIKYQTDWPGYDPMNTQTGSLVQQRVDFYHPDSVGVPYAVMDGVPQTGSTQSYTGAPANFTQLKLTTRANIMSPFTINVSHSFNSNIDSIFITVVINCTQAVSGNLVAQVAVIERAIDFCEAPGTNGEIEFEGVMRDMLPNGNGSTIASSWAVGDSLTLTYKAALPNYIYDKNQLAVVAFVQDVQYCHWPSCTAPTSSVLQAGFSAPLPLITNDVTMACGSGIPRYGACDGPAPLNGTVTIENHGAANLTSANVNYSFDSAPISTVPWTGNLATGATAVVALPTFNGPPGYHTLQTSVSDPNNVADINAGSDMVSVEFDTYGMVGNALPFSEAFAQTAFPPLSWRVINPNNGVTWQRISTYKTKPVGFNGGGCALLSCFNSGAGQVDELWTTNYDFTTAGLTSATLDFDLAYCRYTTENDKLEVLYSTDCGATWTGIFNEAGTVLANGNPDSLGFWVPWNNSQWHHKTVSLTGALGSQSVFVKFKGTSDYGNNLFVDNINVSTNLSTGIPVLNNTEAINVYPNPSNGEFNIQLNLNNSQDVSITVTNALGAIVKTISLNKVSSGIFPVDLSTEAKGTYTVSIKTDDKVITKRISITK